MSHWAEKYIGKPWANGACGPAAYDCHGVVRAAYQDRLDISLPVVDTNALSALSVARAMRHYDYSDWQEIVRPERDFDVVEMSLNKRPHHVGIYLDLDGGGVLTSVEGAGVIFQTLGSLRRHGWNITNVYRRKACKL